MNGYEGWLYVLDFSNTKLYEIKLDEIDAEHEEDIDFILTRRGLRQSQCNYMFSTMKLELDNLDNCDNG